MVRLTAPLLALLAIATLLGPSLLVGAHLPSEGAVLASVRADHLMIADPLWGLDAGDSGDLLSLLPDEETGSASVGKSWALHMALHALDEGLVTLNETITTGQSATNRPCNCITDLNGQPIAQREQFRFWDATMGFYVSSANGLTTVVAEHIGLKLAQSAGGTCSTADPYPSTCMQWFLAWANAHAHSAEVGVSATTQFDRPYIADNVTARDVLKWWVHALEDPVFVQWAGYSGTWTFTSLAPFSKTYSPSRSTPNVVGMEAWKPGATGKCNGDVVGGNGCLVSSAVRLGRRLVASTHQSTVTADAQALYAYGFAKVFHPQDHGVSAPWAPVAQHALACVSPGKAVSAVVRPNGLSRLVLWDVDLEARSIQAIVNVNNGLVPSDLELTGLNPVGPPVDLPLSGQTTPAVRAVNRALAQAPEPQPPGPPTRLPVPLPQPQPPTTLGLPVPDLGEVLQVDVTPLGSSAVVVAQRGPAAVQLSTWGVAPDSLVPLGTTLFPAPGLQGLQLATLTDNRFLLALHEADGDRRLQSWRAHGDGSLELVSSNGATPVEEFDLAVQPYLGAPHVFVGARDIFDLERVEVWRMAGNGALQFVAGNGLNLAPTRLAVSAAPVEPLNGEFIIDPHFAMVFRSADGDARMQHWALENGALVSRGDTVILQDLPANVRFDLAPLASSGLLLASRVDGIGIDLDVYESRRDTATIQALPIGSHTVDPVDDLRGFCKVPYNGAAPSEGDYLLAYDGFFDDALTLSGWRSGALPT